MIFTFIFIFCLISYFPIKNTYYFYKHRIHAVIRDIKYYSADASQANAYHYFYDNVHYLASYEVQDSLKIGDSIVKDRKNDFSFKVFRNGKLLFHQKEISHEPSKLVYCYQFFIPNFGNE